MQKPDRGCVEIELCNARTFLRSCVVRRCVKNGATTPPRYDIDRIINVERLEEGGRGRGKESRVTSVLIILATTRAE